MADSCGYIIYTIRCTESETKYWQRRWILPNPWEGERGLCFKEMAEVRKAVSIYLHLLQNTFTDYRIYVRKKDSEKIMISSPNQIEKMKKLTKEFFLLHQESERNFNKQKWSKSDINQYISTCRFGVDAEGRNAE